MNKRNIKNENEIINVPENTTLIDPTLLIPIKHTNPVCITKFNLDNKNKIFKTINNYKCKDNNINNYKKYLYIPPFGITSSNILRIYNIDTIEDIDKFITINFHNIITFKRIINCWIKNNFDIIKKHPTILNKIILKIIKNEKGSHYNFDKKIIDYIDYWINKLDSNVFNNNIIEDILTDLKK
jgi:hypothetical protein